LKDRTLPKAPEAPKEPELFKMEIGEHYHTISTRERFDAQLVAKEDGFLVFKRAKLLSDKIEGHDGVLEKMPDSFAVHSSQVLRMEMWLPR